MKVIKKIIVIMLFILAIALPQNSFAASLDETIEQFKSDYIKEKHSFNLAQKDPLQIADRKIIVKLAEEAVFAADDFGVRFVENVDERIVVVQVFEDDDYWEKLAELEASSDVLYAEADYLLEVNFVAVDPLVSEQWYLDRIQMSQAWGVTRGSADVTIAILDSGVNGNHPDLKGRVLQGYNFVSNNHNALDDNGHGTHVAGVIAANSNTIGIAGIDHAAKILPIKVFCDQGSGSLSNAIKGIHYAIDQNVDVINMSYVSREKSKAEEEALQKAYNQGIILVAAAGNEGQSDDMYPASYRYVISVAATNEQDKRAKFSNYGNWIDLSAPGKDIYSLNYQGGYGILSGTSFSAPVVSGIAGLLKAKNPEWGPAEVEWALEYGADSVVGDSLEWNNLFGFGRVNAFKAVTAELPIEEATSDEVRVLENEVDVYENLTFPNEVDWFTFSVPDRSEVEIELLNSSNHLDLIGVLYAYDGENLEEMDVMDQGDMGEDEIYINALGAGNYKVAIYDYYGRWSNTPYEVSLSFETNLRFPDVKFYKNEIEFLVEKGIIRGYPNGTFQPTNRITRLQAVQMILRELDSRVEANSFVEDNSGLVVASNSVNSTPPNPNFTDIQPGDYGYEAVARAVELGFIQGKLNNTFDAGGYLTRGQMASILVKAYELDGVYENNFSDILPKHWAYDLVSKLAANGITTGYEDGTYRPGQAITREHFSVFMYRILENR